MLHFGRSDSTLEELAGLPREWFRFAHVCDAAREVPKTMDGIIHTARDERQFPGEGGIDVRGILGCMPQDIPYALEIPRVTLTHAVGPEEVARLAITVTRSYLDGRDDHIGIRRESPARESAADRQARADTGVSPRRL